MISKILKIIDSCKTAEQIGTCSDWLDIVELSHDDKLTAIGAMKLKLKQLSDYGWAKLLTKTAFLLTMNNEIINEVYTFLKRVKAVSKWINREECIKIAQIHFEGKKEHLNVLKQLK